MMQYESPAKRPRVPSHHRSSFDDIVPGIHQAITTAQRFEALQRLFLALQYNLSTRTCHCNSQVFSYMVEMGVVNALFLQLGFAIQRHGSSREELGLLCTAIDVFFRFCPTLANEESLRARGVEIFRLLAEAFSRGAILPVTSIWHSCSACNAGATLLCEGASILPGVERALRHTTDTEDATLEALGLLKNLTYFNEDMRRRTIEEPGFLALLSSIAEWDVCEKSQERQSAIFRNLALSSDTRRLLAQRSDVLTAIARLANSDNRSTLRNLLNTIVSLALDTDSGLMMVFHGDGILVGILKRLVEHGSDATIRKRAARALRLMARETSAPLLVHDSQLMDSLSHRALHDMDSEVRTEAAEAFARCAALVKAPMTQHDAMLEALTRLASSSQVPPEVMARALKEQSLHPENRQPIAQRPELMEALAQIGLSNGISRGAKEDICQTLLDLSEDISNRSLLATSSTLQVLVSYTVDRSVSNTRIRATAVQTILNLAESPVNRKAMAKHANLLQSLLQFVATADSLKTEVKTVIMKLATEL